MQTEQSRRFELRRLIRLKSLLGSVDQGGGILGNHQFLVGGDDPNSNLGIIRGDDGFLTADVVLLGIVLKRNILRGFQ